MSSTGQELTVQAAPRGYVVVTCPLCKAEAFGKPHSSGVSRFKRRHPKLCSERRAFARQLAQTTRAVDDEEGHAGR